jgi:hypothetical protein
MEQMINARKILVGKLEGKTISGRTRVGWLDNIKIVLKETVSEGVDWIHLA